MVMTKFLHSWFCGVIRKRVYFLKIPDSNYGYSGNKIYKSEWDEEFTGAGIPGEGGQFYNYLKSLV
jgi:hypothetical protein